MGRLAERRRDRVCLGLTRLEDRTQPAGLNTTFSGGVLRVADWQAGDTLTLRQTTTGVTLDATGDHRVFSGVGQIFLDVQYDVSALNDTTSLGGAAARPVYLSRRDPTGRTFIQAGPLLPSTLSGPAGPSRLTPTTAPAALDWFDAALGDADVRNLARSLAADGRIDRADALRLFAQVGRDGSVSAAEFNNLGDLIHPERVMGARPPAFSIPEPVRGLVGNVVDGDPANESFQGLPLGDLRAGSGGGQLQTLVNKWFLGLDRPQVQAGETYRPANGSLFGDGPSMGDIRQGRAGDCYYLSALAELAQDRPQAVRDMFTDNGDGTYTVRYFQDGVASYVTVDSFLPTDSGGRLVYASTGRAAGDASNKLWAALAEKAYAQLNQSGWTGQDGTNSYAGIGAGYSDVVMRQVTGEPASYLTIVRTTADLLADAVADQQPTVLNSRPSNPGNGVIAAHAYALVSCDAAGQRFTLFNPLTSGTIQLTFAQIAQSFGGCWQLTA